MVAADTLELKFLLCSSLKDGFAHASLAFHHLHIAFFLIYNNPERGRDSSRKMHIKYSNSLVPTLCILCFKDTIVIVINLKMALYEMLF